MRPAPLARLAPLVLAGLGLAGCDWTGGAPLPPEVPVAAGRPLVLAEGQRGRFGEGPESVTFVDVPRDGRCPTDLMCVWEGEALVVLQWGHDLADVIRPPDTLSTAGRPLGRYPDSLAVAGHVLRLRALDPHRSSTAPRPDRYRATFRVTVAR